MYFLKKQLKKYQSFSSELDILRTYKFYSKDWLFLKISTKFHVESLQFHDLMLLRKFDACFDPPSLCRFLSEHFVPERLF